MADEGGNFPLLALRAGEVVPPIPKRGGGGGPGNPSKQRQIERLGPQFAELQTVLKAGNAALLDSTLGAAPEHVLVFETNGPLGDFFAVVNEHPELEWLFENSDRVDQDDDFKKVGSGQLTACTYMVMFNQRALEQLLSYWNQYKLLSRMPDGLGAWSALFRCLRHVRRWGPNDRLREAERLADALDPINPNHLVPVEIELWPRDAMRRTQAETAVRQLVADAGGRMSTAT